MSMRNITHNDPLELHQEAQRKVAMVGFSAKQLAVMDKEHLHTAAASKRGPEGEACTTLQYFSALAAAEGVGPSDRELREAENYWLREYKVDEKSSPGRAEKIKAFARDRWAVEAVMAEHGVQCRGAHPSTVHKAFTTDATLVVFPFLWDSAIERGTLAEPVIDKLIMMDVPSTNSLSADHASITDTDANAGITLSGEGVPASEGRLTYTHTTIKLTKIAYAERASREALEFSRIPMWETFLMRVGERLMIAICDLGIERLIAGDNGGAAAASTDAAGVLNTPVYTDLLASEFAFAMGYKPETIVGTKEAMRKILAFPQYQDPDITGLQHQVSGNLPTPLGMDLTRWDYTGRATSYKTTNAGDKLLMGQRSKGMIKYTNGGVRTNTSQIVRGDWTRVGADIYTDFGIWDRAAWRVLTGW